MKVDLLYCDNKLYSNTDLEAARPALYAWMEGLLPEDVLCGRRELADVNRARVHSSIAYIMVPQQVTRHNAILTIEEWIHDIFQALHDKEPLLVRRGKVTVMLLLSRC